MYGNIILSLVVLHSTLDAHTLRTGIGEKQKKSGYIDGDFIIGALFPVHERPLLNGSQDPLACGVIRERYGIQRLEAAFFAVDSINNDTNILPDIKLGINIKDECWSESLALHQTIKLIEKPTLGDEDTSNENPCSEKESEIAPLLGIIGPGSSDTTITVQNLLKLFKIPQIGYSATSTDLADEKNYPYFLSMVPNDAFQVYLMFKILKKFNWSYISIVYTYGNYGQSGMNAIRENAAHFKVCIAKIVGIRGSDEEFIYDDAVRQLQEDDKATVVISFCEGISVQGLLRAIRRKNLGNRFLFIGSDAWSTRYSVVQGYEAEAYGSLTIGIKTSVISEFDDYYFQKNLFDNQRNPWFGEFWEYRFDCKINSTEDSKLPQCTGKENLRIDHEQDLKISYVIKSIYVLAYGLHNMQTELCKNQTTFCENLFPFNSTKFLNYLLKTNFTHHGELVSFSKFRTPWQIRYNIFNFQKFPNGSYDYVRVGEYDGDFGELQDYNYDDDFFDLLKLYGDIQFPDGSTNPIKSTCSDPCPAGQIQLSRSTNQDTSCCWNCVPCGSGEIQVNLTTCQRCPDYFWPNENFTSCYEIPLTYHQWLGVQSLVSLAFSLVGIVLTTVTAYIFVKYRDTPVVKSSTRELCYMMLVGMIMAHCIAFAVIAKPSILTCTIVRTIPPISFTIIYAALLVKTNRIARILAISKKKFPNLNPRFMSLRAQITITSILISVEIFICAVMLMKESPIPYKGYQWEFDPPHVSLFCPISAEAILVPFSFVAFFVVMCTLYAIKTRNLPDNFNEAKFIGFSMYVTCVTWIAFGLVYYGSTFQVVTTCICASTNALVILTFLFFPKLYIIIWAPERNTRANFTTSKGIRCIIGREDSSQEANKKKLLETDFKYIPDFTAKRKSLSEHSADFNPNRRKSMSEFTEKI